MFSLLHIEAIPYNPVNDVNLAGGRSMPMRMALTAALVFAGVATTFPNQPAAKDRPECGKPYEIASGDSLYDIARILYGRSSEWSRIFYTNRDALGNDPARIFPGQTIVAPCEASEEDIDDLRAGISERGRERERATVEKAPAPVKEPVEEAETEVQSQPVAPDPPARTDTRVAALPPADADVPPGSSPTRPAPAALYAAPVSFLTADDFRPFTDRSLPAGGMITQLVSSAMRQADIPHEIVWINDRSAHLDPLLDRHLFDFGFPWAKPDCEGREETAQCRDLLYSAPVFEVLIKFFTLRESGLGFERDGDVEGRRLCRPAGHDVSDLDADGRNWLRDGKIILIRPDAVRKCFDLLVEGKVDAVAINEFTGLEAVAQLDIGDKVAPTLRALATEPLHLVIAKRHPRASVLMFRVNEALADMRENGTYKQTVSDHLALFWRDNG